MATKNLLLVFPQDETMDILKDDLIKNGFRVEVTHTAKEGFGLAKTIKPDIILAAHQAYGINGIDFCFMVRNSTKLASIPFILYTDYLNRDERISAYRNGVDAIVISSISTRELIVQIEMLILHHQLLTKDILKSSQTLMGKIEHFKLIEILQMLNMNQKSGMLTVYHEYADGQIALNAGEITFAIYKDFLGEEAIQQMVRWTEGIFIFESDVSELEQNIEKPTMQLILDCCQMLDESPNPSD